MAIFAKKHLDAKQNKLYSFIIKLAIWIKAFFGFFSRIPLYFGGFVHNEENERGFFEQKRWITMWIMWKTPIKHKNE